MKIHEALRWARSILKARTAMSSPVREASWLLARLLDRPEIWLRAHDDEELSPAEFSKFREWIEARQSGEPAEYIVGNCSFGSRDFRVSHDVLIPRPESELIVEAALKLNLPPAARILDVGTGSGCLAISLAAEHPDFRVTALDLSFPALEIARSNARKFGVSINFIRGSLSACLGESFDLVVANLPYLPGNWMNSLPIEVRREPEMALNGGPDGLVLIRRLLDDLPRILPRGACVVLEVAEGHEEILRASTATRNFRFIQSIPDTGGCMRVLLFERA